MSTGQCFAGRLFLPVVCCSRSLSVSRALRLPAFQTYHKHSKLTQTCFRCQVFSTNPNVCPCRACLSMPVCLCAPHVCFFFFLATHLLVETRRFLQSRSPAAGNLPSYKSFLVTTHLQWPLISVPVFLISESKSKVAMVLVSYRMHSCLGNKHASESCKPALLQARC